MKDDAVEAKPALEKADEQTSTRGRENRRAEARAGGTVLVLLLWPEHRSRAAGCVRARPAHGVSGGRERGHTNFFLPRRVPETTCHSERSHGPLGPLRAFQGNLAAIVDLIQRWRFEGAWRWHNSGATQKTAKSGKIQSVITTKTAERIIEGNLQNHQRLLSTLCC